MKRSVIIVSIVFVACVAAWTFQWAPRQEVAGALTRSTSFEGRDGKAEAEADIGRGTPKWKAIGLESSDLERRVVLLDRLGVQLDRIADCEVDAPLLKYVEAYNAATRRHVTLKHGASAIDTALSDADIMSIARRKKKG
jgi:hypothetical protein